MDHQVGNITLNKYLARTGSCQDISRNPAVTAPYPEKFGFLLMLLVINGLLSSNCLIPAEKVLRIPFKRLREDYETKMKTLIQKLMSRRELTKTVA